VAATVNNLHDITFMAAKGSWAADAAELAMQHIQELRSSLTAAEKRVAFLEGLAATSRSCADALATQLTARAWQPIETAPIRPFDEEQWYRAATERLLLWCGSFAEVGQYRYHKSGKRGGWTSGRKLNPTHWMPLPEVPK
jgi:hypothetical protein